MQWHGIQQGQKTKDNRITVKENYDLKKNPTFPNHCLLREDLGITGVWCLHGQPPHNTHTKEHCLYFRNHHNINYFIYQSKHILLMNCEKTVATITFALKQQQQLWIVNRLSLPSELISLAWWYIWCVWVNQHVVCKMKRWPKIKK